MDGGTGAELLSPAEAEWPPELRLPPPPPQPARPLLKPKEEPSPAAAPHIHLPHPPLQPKKEPSPPRHAEGFDDQHFLGSIMGAAAQSQPQQPPAPAAPVKRKRGRPPKNRDAAAAAAAPAPAAPAPAKTPAKKKEEEIVCFICFDGGNLVVCDRRGCPKVYHPACVKRDESFFRARGKWDCGWHICSICEKAAHYMCYTCTYSLCKGCITQGSFFGVRGNKGFCDTCYGTILLIESKDHDRSKIRVDFDDKNSWEYLFKLYWLDVKGKNFLTSEELIKAKSRWIVPTTGRREKEDSSDESYDANNDKDASFDVSSRKRRQNNSSGKRGRKRQKDLGVTAKKHEFSTKGSESLPNRLTTEGTVLQGDTKWASPELLEFIGHMRNGDSSYISQYDVHVLLLEYITQNNLRDPRKKSQIICDARLSNLFRKPRVAHFEMLKLLEMHFVKDNPTVNADVHPDSAQLGSDKRRKIHKKIEKELTANPEDYAAIDMHNINLIYLRRSLMEDLIDDNATFSDKIAGAFVRIRICDLAQKQDMYRLVKVLGTHKVAERYSVGKKTTDYALEISNLDKKDVITMDTISNQDFTEEECRRLRQSMRFGLVARLKVADIYEKAKIFRSLQFNDWLENEKQRLSHLRDRASETGRRKELRECVEKLQLLNTPEERARKINEIPEVHVDPCMAPDYESAEEQYYKAADRTINRSRSDLLFPERTGTKSNSVENHTQKSVGASGHMINLPIQNMAYRSGALNNLKNTAVEATPLPSSGVILSDTEPEKVWHYKDPSGNVQGPFTLLQLSKWVNHFPRDLRIWLTFESEKNSLLLTEVLLKQQKDFVTTSAVNSIGTGTRQDRTNSGLVANNSSSPIGYSVVYSPALSCQSAEFSDPTKEGSKVLCGTLPSRSLKDAHSLHDQVQHPAKYSCTISSSTPPCSHNVGVPREQVGEWNNRQTIGCMWNPTVSSMNHRFKSDVEPHPSGYAIKDQLQNDSKSILPARSLEIFDYRRDSSSQKVSVLTPQQSDRDTKPSSEVNTVCKDKDPCWHSATNAGTHDNLQLYIALAKPESCSPTNPVEDRDSSSAGVPNQLGAPACRSQQVPSMSTTASSKTEATINQHNTSLTDASSKPSDQHSELNNDPVFSCNTQDCEYEYPSPTPKLEMEEISMNQSGSTSVTPKDSGTKICVHSSISFVSESSGPPAGKICSLQSLKQTSCLEESQLRDRDTTAQEQVNEENTAVKRKNIVGNPISDDEGIAVSDVLESLTEQNCEKNILLGEDPLENFVPASAEEEQPQCSSPIALSPWGEQNYYQGEAVDSALWGVQDNQSNDIWSMPSPTPALQSSSGLGVDGKDASRVIEEVVEARESTFVDTLLKQREKKVKLENSGASTGSGALEEVRAKQSVVSGPSLDASTKTADWQSSGTSLEGSAKAYGWKPPGLSLQGITKASDCQPSGPSPKGGLEGQQPSDITKEGGSKASGWQSSDSTLGKGAKASGWGQWKTEWGTKVSDWQRSSSFPDGSTKGSCWQPPGSTEGSAKASGRQQSSASPEGIREASGCQWSVSSAQGNTKGSGWQPSAERSAKVDAWQRTNSSPEGSRKASGWHSSGRESSRANSTLGANEHHKSSSSHRATTPTAKHSWEASKRQGNNDKNTAGWGEALGNNRSWYPCSGDASRGSQGGHNHERYSHGRDSQRGSSNHSRRSDHHQDHDHRRDHGRGGSSDYRQDHDHRRDRGRSGSSDHRQDHGHGRSSRSLSRGQSPRGQSPRGVCKYHESGHCFKGANARIYIVRSPW